MLKKCSDIVKRVHALEAGTERTPLEPWRAQLAEVIAEINQAPASDGEAEAFVSRKHLKEMRKLAPTLDADAAGTELLQAVLSIPVPAGDGNDVEEFDSSPPSSPGAGKTIDFGAVYELEQAVKHADTLPLPALFVEESVEILARRTVERALVEGVEEDDVEGLKAALADAEARPELGVSPALVPAAKRTIERIDCEALLEAGVEERSAGTLNTALERAAADAKLGIKPQLVEAAKAMIEKLKGFDSCESTMQAKDADGLKQAIEGLKAGWWQAEHWTPVDKSELSKYVVAYKRLTVLIELEKHMEPLNIMMLQARATPRRPRTPTPPHAPPPPPQPSTTPRQPHPPTPTTQGALDTALSVKVADPLVDKAIEILKAIDRETVKGEFKKPLSSGGAHGGPGWASNPQYRASFSAEAPPSVRLAITMIEGGDDDGDGDADGDFFGDFAVHLVRNPAGSDSTEALPEAEVFASSEYNEDTTMLIVDDVDSTRPFFIVPSTKVADEEGPFVINVIVETPHADLSVETVVKIGDQVLEAIMNDDIERLSQLLEKPRTRVHGTKGLHYLNRRKREIALRKCCDARGTIEELETHLEGSEAAGCSPHLVEEARALLAQLLAVRAMEEASKAADWKQLEAAIHQARAAAVDEPTIEPFLSQMLKLRAAARLRDCLTRGEEGYVELQAMYDDALAAELSGDDVDEAKRILDALKDAKRSFTGTFEKWMGGGYENELWVDNPQYKLTVGERDLKVSVAVDKSGGAEYEAYSVHVVKPTEQGAAQVSKAHEVVVAAEYDGDTSSLKFDGAAGATYLLVASPLEPKSVGGFSITTIGVGAYTLEEVAPVQLELKAAMAASAFESLPALVDRAEGSTVDLAWHPLVVGAKLISEIERGWQAKSAEIMGPAISSAKAAKVDKNVIKVYGKRYKQLAIEKKLADGLAGDTPLLLAAYDEAKLIGYDQELFQKAKAAVGKFKCYKSVGDLFMDETAAGAMKFGNWRENPTYKLQMTKKDTVYLALNEDGVLAPEEQAIVDAKKKKKDAAYEKARDKMAVTQAAADADEKDDEAKAAAKDAARVFKELDDARAARQAKIDMGDDDMFGALGLHVVRNTRESWIPGVLSGFQVVKATDPYGDDQAYLAIELDPADGPVFIVPSTWEAGEEGVYTLSAMANSAFTFEIVTPFEGDMIRLKGAWTTKNEGPRAAKNGQKEDGKKFTPQKTWNKNPQFRVWLKDPDDGKDVESVGLQIVLSTPIEEAELGLHIMRNTYCQFYNEKIEVLADRYQKVVTSTERHEKANEIAMDIVLDRQFEVKKNGCEEGFPFFIVPSLFDKKMDGNFQLLVYSEKPIVIQMLDDAARKL